MIIYGKHINILITLLRIALGLFFLAVGIGKLTQIDSLQQDIVRFDIVPPGWEWYLACLGVAAELCLAVCLLSKKLYVAATWAGCALTACFVAIFLQAWLRGLTLSCSCLGVERAATNYPFEISWRIVLFLLMLLLAKNSLKRKSLFFADKD